MGPGNEKADLVDAVMAQWEATEPPSEPVTMRETCAFYNTYGQCVLEGQDCTGCMAFEDMDDANRTVVDEGSTRIQERKGSKKWPHSFKSLPPD